MKLTESKQKELIKKELRRLQKAGYHPMRYNRRGHPFMICRDEFFMGLLYGKVFKTWTQTEGATWGIGTYTGLMRVYAACNEEEKIS